MPNRWIYVIFGLIINLMLGAIYSFSLFRIPLEKMWNISAIESGYPFMVFLLTFALTMPLGGSAMYKWGIKKTMIIGSILVGIGWMLAGLSPNIYVLTIVYGIIGGSGVGLVYGCPIACITRWFPDRAGLAIGLTVGGFGLSALVVAPLITFLIASIGPLSTFTYLGGAFMLLLALLSLPFKFPPEELKPSQKKLPVTTSIKDYNLSEAMKSLVFWVLFMCYIVGTTAGLMAIGIASPVGKEVGVTNTLATVALSIFAIFNFVGRPLFGWLTDKIKPMKSSIISFVIIILASILIYTMRNIVAFFISFSLLWLCLGGWLAIAPASTKIFFGTKYYGKNYGLMFIAYGVGAIVGMLLSGAIKDITGTYFSVFPVVALLVLVGIFLSIFLRHSKSNLKSSNREKFRIMERLENF